MHNLSGSSADHVAIVIPVKLNQAVSRTCRILLAKRQVSVW